MQSRWGRALVSSAAMSLVLWALGCDETEDTRPTGTDSGADNPQPGGPGGPNDGGNRPPTMGDAGPITGNPQTNPDGGPPIVQSAFAVRGRLASAPGDKRQKGPGDAAIEHSVTHVMAVNPSSANPIRRLAQIEPDGTFAIGIDLNTPWVIVLVDSHYVGTDMVAGVFRARDFDLETLAATAPGSLDLGDLTVEPTTGTASASVTTSDLLTALRMSTATATLLGALDDVSLRYVNPDVDGNGKIDIQEGVSYALDFHLRYTMTRDGQTITFKDLLHQFASETTTEARYGLGSAIAIWDPARFGATSAADYRIKFPDASGSFTAQPLPGSFSAGVWIEEDSFFYTSAGSNSLGISFDQRQPFPVGQYVFEVKGTALTFSEVRTHTLAELNSSDNLLIPFLRLVSSDPSCSDWSCPVSAIDYRWMRSTAAGWVLATAEEIALLIPQRGGFLGFQPSGDRNKRLEYTIPGSPTSGTIALASPQNTQGGVTPAEISALTVGQLCHVGVSYDDTLGMRIFQGWESAPACNPSPTGTP